MKIIPFINDEKTFYGDVTEINPLIDEHGQVKIREGCVMLTAT